MSDVTPAEWFDQLPSAPGLEDHPQWCGRHWAPALVLGANGLHACMVVMDRFVNDILIPEGISPRDYEAANARFESFGKLCCWLGDEEMYRVWGQCPPSAFEISPN